ncbi:MAG: PQQ-binding-like beta-propeller repeat protein [Phycisphaerae bacterium]|nr:PQQ-binding-like beta-propeller repeat protein [Phycisphaerae bacterium]
MTVASSSIIVRAASAVRATRSSVGIRLGRSIAAGLVGLAGVVSVSLTTAEVTAASSRAPGQAAPVNPSSPENRARLAALATEVEQQYVIGPKAAGELGFRIMWQARIPAGEGAQLEHLAISDDAMFAIDSTNSIARLRPSDGQQIWRVAVANPVDIFRGVHWIELPVTTGVGRSMTTAMEARVFISTDTECFVLSGDAGALLGRQIFRKLPTTPPLVAGRFLVYGTLGGQVVWHHYGIGEEWRANSLSGTIRGNLTQSAGAIVATSVRGDVMSLDAGTAGRRWARTTFGGIVASPAIGPNEVFVASTDQYLWAFDLRNGAMLWKYFTESPLTTPPFAFGDGVLQYVPTEGLVCLNARTDKIDGDVRWSSKDAVGIPIGVIGEQIAMWDAQRHVLTLIDKNHGSIVSATILTKVDELQLVSEGPFAGDIVALSNDGRIVRLTPKNPRTPSGFDEMEAQPAGAPVANSAP